MAALTVEDISLEIASGVACALSQVVPDGVLHLRPFSVTDEGRLSISDAPRIPQSAVPANKMRFEVGDILFNNTNSVELVGKSAVFSAALDASFSNHMTRIRIDRRYAEPGYVHAFLRHLYGRRFFQDRATRWVSQAAFGTAQLKALEVPLPPLDEQRRIVGLLDRAAEIRRRADAARAKARAIIPALFLNTFGDPATNPKGWPVVTLGDLDGMELRNGISPSKAGKVSGNVLTLSAITRGAFDPSARKDAMFAGPLAAEQRVSKSLFLICRGNGNRALVGQGAFPLMDMPGVAFPDTMIALLLPEHEVAPPYLAAVWSSEHVRAQIDAAAKTTNGTFKISQSGILRFSFPLPPRPLQISFGERVSRLETLARHLDAAAAKAEAMAAGLSAEVFG
jgi:type I restriction enzyme S subunit